MPDADPADRASDPKTPTPTGDGAATPVTPRSGSAGPTAPRPAADPTAAAPSGGTPAAPPPAAAAPRSGAGTATATRPTALAPPASPAVKSGELWPGAHPLPPLWSERVWPVSTAPAPLATLVGAVVSGFLGATVLVADEAGIGLGLLALAAILTALATKPRVARPRQLLFGALAVGLFGTAAVRTAPWLLALCVLAGLVLAVLAVTAGRTWTGLTLGLLSPLSALSRTARWAARGVTPRLRGRRVPVGRALATGAASVVLLTVFGGLFAGADPVFADLLGGLVPELPPVLIVVRTVVFAVVTVGVLVAACLAHQRPDFDALAPTRGTGRPRLEWAVPLGALIALFACFVGVQFVVLADGERHVLRTAGLTYAEYARQGFWQLLAVTALTLLVVAVVVRVARRETRADRAVLRVLLGALCLLAVLVVASALRRMWLYEDAYGFTRLRLLVQAVEFWLGSVFVLVGLAGIRLRVRWLPRAVVATGALTMLALATVNPDAFIAERAVVRYTETGRIDLGYLAGLSSDAVPALDRLPEPQRACTLLFIDADLAWGEPWYAANLGRARARDVLRDRPAGSCSLPLY